jgi:hypothetical protein
MPRHYMFFPHADATYRLPMRDPPPMFNAGPFSPMIFHCPSLSLPHLWAGPPNFDASVEFTARPA